MRKIYTIGETVLDIVFKNSIPVTAKAGGSMLNTAVSIGRLGLPVSFISEYALDEIGDMIDNFLKLNGTDNQHVYRYNDGKSALALAFLDDKNNAAYSFYKAYSAHRLNISFPEVKKDDIVMFGSYYGMTYEIRDILKDFLLKAKKNGALIIYDPNFRKSHLFEIERLKPAIIENMTFATIVRCSNEDVEMIFNAENVDDAYKFIGPLCPNMIYTSSSNAVYLHTPNIQTKYPVKKISPVSTIGAGDNFNAGLIFGLYKNQIKLNNISDLSAEHWQRLVTLGVEFASDVCMSYENYISIEFAKNIIKN